MSILLLIIFELGAGMHANPTLPSMRRDASRRLEDVATEKNGSPVATESGSTTEIYKPDDCSICFEPVYERSTENRTEEDMNTIAAFRCGHFNYMDNDCFNELVFTEMAKPAIRCSICRKGLYLNARMKAKILKKRTYVFNEDVEKLRIASGISMSSIVERWPDILKIGRVGIYCTGAVFIKLINCAYFVMRNPQAEDRVTAMMNQFRENQIDFISAKMQKSWPTLRIFEVARVYDDYGDVITLQHAYFKSLNVIDGRQFEEKLQNINIAMAQVSYDKLEQGISRFPKLIRYKNEMMFINGVNTKISIFMAGNLIHNEHVNSESFQEKLQALNQGFADTKDNVDGFIQQYYPLLVDFKDIGPFDPRIQQKTVRYYAQMVINPYLEDPLPRTFLNNINEGAAIALNRDINFMIATKYEHCWDILSRNIQNVPGRGISFHTALRYAANPRLVPEDKSKWDYEINSQLRALECTPLQVPLNEIDRENFALQRIQASSRNSVNHASVLGIEIGSAPIGNTARLISNEPNTPTSNPDEPNLRGQHMDFTYNSE